MKIRYLLSIILLLTGVTILLAITTEPEKPLATPMETTAYQNVLAAPPLPTTLKFAGEEVPLDIYWVREGLERELIINCFQHSKTLTTIKKSARFFPVMEKILIEEGVPSDLLYLCVTESNLENVVSPAKASGFWQFMTATGKNYGLEITDYVDERYHLEKATRAACKYLKNAKKRFGTWSLAAAAYNMGEAGLQRSLDRQLCDNYWDLFLNQETQRYVYRILAYKLMFENKETYRIFFNEQDYYQPIAYVEDTITSTIENLMVYSMNKNISYRELKELNPWLRSVRLPVSGKTYLIRLPEKSVKFAGRNSE